MDIIVGIGEYVVSDKEEDVLKTFALGSCVAVTAYNPEKKVLGMVHIALPDSKVDLDGSIYKPGHFADTAIPRLLDVFSYRYGCNKKSLIFNMYGGAKSIQSNDIFKIGKRNIETIVEILRKNSLTLNQCEIGGFVSRTIEADVISGKVKLSVCPIKI